MELHRDGFGRAAARHGKEAAGAVGGAPRRIWRDEARGARIQPGHGVVDLWGGERGKGGRRGKEGEREKAAGWRANRARGSQRVRISVGAVVSPKTGPKIRAPITGPKTRIMFFFFMF